MNWQKVFLIAIISGIVFGICLFMTGAITAAITYGPSMAPEGKFKPEKINAWYFFWTKIVIGIVFAIIYSLIYEKLPVSMRINGVLKGLKYAFWLWLIIFSWGLSHKVVYETLEFRNQLFWMIYTLGGYLGFGAAYGYLRMKLFKTII